VWIDAHVETAAPAVQLIQVRHHAGYGRPSPVAKKIGVRYSLAVAADDLIDRHGVLREKVIGFEYTDTNDHRNLCR